ncbi:TetR/AcrR family transcriptional regulator [Priestia koreensis]|uniref:TetR/AcrR family transcriptional regulator n=1 Tax=Priestia koreensis TaxID=284581 RepID=UPI001F5629A8|nr:TetR/AcrR family transcriptional regulator [Priestia koreensis]UNL86874.1 TetR/AcrR family transcriptional regulator [Priestia koreensis]
MDKKQQIIDESIKVFVEYGFHGAPITKLVKSAHVSNGTFFYYFKTKEDLITAIYVSTKEEIYHEIVLDIKEVVSVKKSMRNLWMNWANWGIANEQKFKFLEIFASSPYINSLEKKEVADTFIFIEELLQKGIRDEIIIPMDITLLSHIFYSSIRTTIMYQQIKSLSQEEMETIFNLMWKSIVDV